MGAPGRQVVRTVKGYSNGPLRIPYEYGVLDCGHDSKVVAVGAAVECERCAWQAQALEQVRQAIAEGRVTHSRYRPWAGANLIHVYQRDETSPTGVRLLCSVEEGPEADALLRGGLAPLSPTEGR